MKKKRLVKTENAPIPAGHYSQAVVYGDLVFVSGVLPIKPVTNEVVLDDNYLAVKQVFENLSNILISAGSALSCLLKTTVYISNIDLWGEINKYYAEILGEIIPARTVIEVQRLHHGVIIEIEAVAHLLENPSINNIIG